MKKIIIPIVLLLAVAEITLSQEKMEVEGAIIIKDSEALSPTAGTIRFNPTTNDFEGWNGHQWLSLTRLRESGGGVTDADGNTYTTVKLGTQEWMVENLRTTKYNDSIGILNVTDDIQWSELDISQTGAWCYYNNDGDYNTPYGKLYNWYAVATGKLCPTGWNVPSDAEWTTLTDYLGGIGIAGGKIKETGTTHWNIPNTGATNESGFAGLPGGVRKFDGIFFDFSYFGHWWSSTGSGSNAWYRLTSYNDDNVVRNSNNKRRGRSVRCVRD